MVKETTYLIGLTDSMWWCYYFIGKIKPWLCSIHLGCLRCLVFDNRTTYFRNIFCPFLPIGCELVPLLMKFPQLPNHTYASFGHLSMFRTLTSVI